MVLPPGGASVTVLDRSGSVSADESASLVDLVGYTSGGFGLDFGGNFGAARMPGIAVIASVPRPVGEAALNSNGRGDANLDQSAALSTLL